MLSLNNLNGFTTQLATRLKRCRQWASKSHVTCFCFYDCHVAGFDFVAHLYEDHFVFWHLNNDQDELPEEFVREVIKACKTDRNKVIFKKKTGQKKMQYERYDHKHQMITIREGGLKFQINLSDYLHTGLFLDHRWTRSYVRDLAAGLRILNLFAYTGSFSLYAAQGWAFETVSVDLNPHYLQWARENFVLNGLEGAQHHFVQEDCLEFLRAHTQRYDMIILDAPTFSNSKKMKHDFDLQKDHVWLIQQCLQLLYPGGLLLFSHNFQSFKLDANALLPAVIQNISAITVPKDFRRTIHKTYLISQGDPMLRLLPMDREIL